jgi:hypothetical protein
MKDVIGAMIKHKDRLVAKGCYVQREGVDFDKVFGPVRLLNSVCVLVAIATRKKGDLQHLDVKLAFLNGDIQKKVYVAQPLGFTCDSEQCKVYRVSGG